MFEGRSEESTANEVSGQVTGSSVQAGVIHGGMHVHVDSSATSPSTVPGSPSAVPRMLPKPPHFFTSRGNETEAFQAALAEPGAGPVLIVVSGVGGVGKSTLVSQWLDVHQDQYPNGSLYADLGAFSPVEPTSVSAVLEGFLRALGIAVEQIPSDPAQLHGLYRQLTAGKRLLVFLDDAFSAAQVRMLVPESENALVVVTSRHRLAGLSLQGARFLEIPALETTTSLRLLRNVGDRRIEEEPEVAERLAELCAGLPVALVVVGARLAAHGRWSLRRVAADLEDERRRLSSLALQDDLSVHAVFDVSYRKLTDDQAAVYRTMADHPGPVFGPNAAAVALERSLPNTANLLETLVDVSLLTEIDEDRFRFHDLLRLHARERAAADMTTPEREATRRRVIEWYLDCAFAADVLITPGRWYLADRAPLAEPPFDDVPGALAWLEGERANLLLAQRQAWERSWPDLVWQFGEALWSLFVYRKHYRDWLESTEFAVQAAEVVGDLRAESRLRGQYGHAYLNLHRFDEGQQQLELAMHAAERSEDLPSQATAISRLGILAKQRGRLSEALDLFRRALEIDRRLDEYRGAALRLRRIGETLAEMQCHDEAAAELERAARLMTELPDAGGAARVLTFLGETYAAAGRPGDAVVSLQGALGTMREIGSDFYTAELLAALGTAHERAGDLDQAKACLRQAFELYERTGGPHADALRTRLDQLSRSATGSESTHP